MIGDAITLIEFLSKKADELQTISAMFSWNGKRIDGSDKITVEIHPMSGEDPNVVWYYKIKPLDGYVFIRFPLNPTGVVENHGCVNNEKAKDSEFFRYIAAPDGIIYGGTLSNVKVDFIVVGYKPNILLKITSATPISKG